MNERREPPARRLAAVGQSRRVKGLDPRFDRGTFLMVQVDVPQMQADVAHYLEQVALGETIVVTRDDQPIAEFRPIASPAPKRRAERIRAGRSRSPQASTSRCLLRSLIRWNNCSGNGFNTFQ